MAKIKETVGFVTAFDYLLRHVVFGGAREQLTVEAFSKGGDDYIKFTVGAVDIVYGDSSRFMDLLGPVDEVTGQYHAESFIVEMLVDEIVNDRKIVDEIVNDRKKGDGNGDTEV